MKSDKLAANNFTESVTDKNQYLDELKKIYLFNFPMF